MGILYEHWRLDTNECFYIGKSMAKDPYDRAHDLSPRNKDHKRIVAELIDKNLIEIRVSNFPNITKISLNNLEKLTIAQWKMYVGGRLTNKTKGGDGGDTFSGMDENRYKEVCLKVSEGQKNMPKEAKIRRSKKVAASNKAIWDSKTEEELAVHGAKVSEGQAKMSLEKKMKQRINMSISSSAAWAAKTDEKRLEDCKKMSVSAQRIWSSKTEEELAAHGAKTKAGHAKRTKEQKAVATEKRLAARKIKDAAAKAAGLPTQADKRLATIREKAAKLALEKGKI
jgi:hypothetical protein